jgi:hypothetical protein
MFKLVKTIMFMLRDIAHLTYTHRSIYIYIYYIHMIELLFVLNQNNYDIIYIFLVDNFLHLFSKSILNICYVLT